jgi:predicted PurR-regulated permease PerM
VRVERVVIERDPGRVVAAFGSALLFLVAIWVLRPIAAPLLWAALVGYLLWPLNERARRLTGGRKSAAALVVSLLALFGLLVPLLVIGASFAQQSVDLAHGLSKVQVADEIRRVPWLSNAIDWAQANSHIGGETLRQHATAALAGALTWLASRLGQVFAGAAGVITGLALTLFVMFFVLRDGKSALRTFLSALPFDEERKQRFVVHVGEITRGTVVGSLATAVVQGALVGVAFATLGLPSAVVFGVIAALVSVLPLGTAIVWVPASVVLVLLGRFGAAAFLVLWGVFVVSVIDNLIRPKIVSGRANVPTLPVFLGIVGGIASIGLLGLVVGPIVLVLAVELVAELSKARQEGTRASSPETPVSPMSTEASVTPEIVGPPSHAVV